MRRLLIPTIPALALALVVVTFGVIQIARGQADISGNHVPLQRELEGENVREISAPAGEAPDSPNISFIESPTVACVQPDPVKDECFVNWYYISVNGAPNSMRAMTVTLNTIGHVGRYQGFFQNSMYVPYAMNPRGYKVACGELGAGGFSQLGNSYPWTIEAKDSANLRSANYGTAYCPAFTP